MTIYVTLFDPKADPCLPTAPSKPSGYSSLDEAASEVEMCGEATIVSGSERCLIVHDSDGNGIMFSDYPLTLQPVEEVDDLIGEDSSNEDLI